MIEQSTIDYMLNILKDRGLITNGFRENIKFTASPVFLIGGKKLYIEYIIFNINTKIKSGGIRGYIFT